MAPFGPRPRVARRRGLIVGAAVGTAVGHAAGRSGQQPAAEEQAPQAPAAEAPANQYESQLRDVEDLKAKGMITDDEYAAKRKQILGL